MICQSINQSIFNHENHLYFAVYFGVFEDDPRQVNTSVHQHAHPAQEDEISRLQSLGFRLSPSQLCTPADGNCMYHVLADQSSFVHHLMVTVCTMY